MPLDPAYPLERLGFMLTDSTPVLALTHGAVAEPVQELLRSQTAVVDLTADAPLWADAVSDNLDRAGLDSQHLAYVIYTSGSTGQPKA